MDRMSDSISLDSAVETQSGFDVATYVAAAAFNTAALPPHMPEFLKHAVQAASDRERQTYAAANNDVLSGDSKEAREKKATERASDQIQWIARDQQQEREREEWARTTSTAGGVAMTGAQWNELTKRLRDDDGLRSQIMAAFMERGMTEKEAEARYERIAEVSEIMAIPPSQRTSEQKQTVAKAEADPSFKTDQQTASDFAKDDSPSASSQLQTSFAAASTGVAATMVIPTAPVERPTVNTNGPGF